MAIKEGWEIVCGLEVHCELKTATKLFCACANRFGAEPNTNVCPVCLGLPGSLPVLNKHAVELAMRIGAALGCEIRPSTFHRKNYFYPDMPKDYQVSQYDEPLNVAGSLELPDGMIIGITRAHMEEDTGKTTHLSTSGRIHGAEASLVDYNRSGVPLVEIVSEPDIRGVAQAQAYVKELRQILVTIGASDGKMEEGSMRCDVNVSVRRPGEPFGTRCEIKNVNSIRAVGRAIEYEANRQIDLVEAGERVRQETRHWNDDEGRTSTMRSKEQAEDYRYFLEPDLVPLRPSREWIASVRAGLPALPRAVRAALSEATNGELRPDADVIINVQDQGLDALALSVIGFGADARRTLNRVANDVAAASVEQIAALEPARLAELIAMESAGALTATQAKQVLTGVLAGEGSPAEIAAARGFEALDNSALVAAVDAAIAQRPAEFERFRSGDAKVAGVFVGAVMKSTGGKADGKTVTALLRARAGLD